jgi:hypothetical protein
MLWCNCRSLNPRHIHYGCSRRIPILVYPANPRFFSTISGIKSSQLVRVLDEIKLSDRFVADPRLITPGRPRSEWFSAAKLNEEMCIKLEIVKVAELMTVVVVSCIGIVVSDKLWIQHSHRHDVIFAFLIRACRTSSYSGLAGLGCSEELMNA